MTREQAIEKIKKLQTLKEGAAKIDSDGEAKNAAAIIDKLQKQFNISMEEIYAAHTSSPETTSYSQQANSSSAQDTCKQSVNANSKTENAYNPNQKYSFREILTNKDLFEQKIVKHYPKILYPFSAIGVLFCVIYENLDEQVDIFGVLGILFIVIPGFLALILGLIGFSLKYGNSFSEFFKVVKKSYKESANK